MGYWSLMSRFEKEGQRLVCEKCGFETNSQEIFVLHKKNCPRIWANIIAIHEKSPYAYYSAKLTFCSFHSWVSWVWLIHIQRYTTPSPGSLRIPFEGWESRIFSSNFDIHTLKVTWIFNRAHATHHTEQVNIHARMDSVENFLLGVIVTFWLCVVMSTEFRDHVEKFGEEIFRAVRKTRRTRLKCKLYNHSFKTEIFTEDLEYKTCRLDHTLTDMWSQHSTDAALTFLTINYFWTPLWKQFETPTCNLPRREWRIRLFIE